MRKVKVMTFADGRQAFSLGGMSLSVNKEEPIDIQELDMEDLDAKIYSENPNAYELVIKAEKATIKEI